jgi:L-lactate dehydrogenase complex protein LldG
VFQPSRQDLEIEFAEQFTKLQGKFVFCVDHRELTEQLNALVAAQGWKNIFCREEKLRKILEEQGLGSPLSAKELGECDAAITTCESLIARTGSIVLSASSPSGRTVSVYAPVHICVAYTDQLVYDIRDGLLGLKEKYHQQLPSLISFATGPSRTADIEKTLVVGVHGPKQVYLFLVDRH